jgi:hypothetical protein
MKYSFENHIFETIEECLEEYLNEKERYWQEFYNVLGKNGLNCKLTKTTDKSGKHSEETKQKISKANKNKPKSEEFKNLIREIKLDKKFSLDTKQKISQSKKGHECYNNPQRGEKISLALKGKKRNHKVIKGKEKKGKKQEEKFKTLQTLKHSKPILQYDLDENFIREWDSIKQASDILKINRENIGSVLRNITKTAGNFKWKYK